MSDPNPTLQQAHRLIEDGQLAEARALLEPLIESGNASPDVLWLYLHAVEDPEVGKQVAAELAQQDPQYPGIQDVATEAGIVAAPAAATQPSTPATNVNEEAVDDEFGDLGEPEVDGDRRRVPFMVILLSVLIVILVILVLVNPFAQATSDGTDQTQVAEVPTESTSAIVDVTENPEDNIVPTVASELTPAEETPTAEPELMTVTEDIERSETEIPEASPESAEGDANPLAAQFLDFDLAENAIVQADTELGDTTVVRICGVPGPVAGAHITNALIVFASINDQVDSDAVGVSIVNCDTDTPFREIGVTKADLTALADGEISEDELGSRIRPIDAQ